MHICIKYKALTIDVVHVDVLHAHSNAIAIYKLKVATAKNLLNEIGKFNQLKKLHGA